MRKSRFSESQIVGILKEAESGVPVADLLRQHGISRTTFFKWRSKYTGASVADVKRLRELEGENAKLKRMYADLALENAAIKDLGRGSRIVSLGLSRTRRTGSIPTCCAICRSRGRTTCGARMLPISRCSEAFCTSSR